MRLSPVLSRRAIAINEERPTVVNAMTWVLRGLLGVGGAILAFVAWPVANGAWQAQKADAVVFELRTGQALDLASVQAGIAALDRAVAADPVAGRRLGRSELLAGAALTTDLPVTREQRAEWMKQAQGDLDFGLGNAPARGVGWARLAAARQALDGTSAQVVAALMMSIDVAPMMALAVAQSPAAHPRQLAVFHAQGARAHRRLRGHELADEPRPALGRLRRFARRSTNSSSAISCVTSRTPRRS